MTKYRFKLKRDWAEFKEGQVVEIIYDHDSNDYFMALDSPRTYQVPILLTSEEFSKLIDRMIIERC